MKTIDLMKNHPVSVPMLNRLDTAGGVLSSLCAVHCLCMPLVLGLLPALGLGFLASQRLELVVALVMLLLAAACLWLGCRMHRRWWLFAVFGLGAQAILYVQLTAKDCCAAEAFSWPNAITMMAGGSIIAASHFLNRRFRCGCWACPVPAPAVT
jgi:hypothetical protein